MKKLLLPFLMMLIALPLFAQEAGEGMSPEQQAWMEYMTPGEQHKLISKATGNWKYTSIFWVAPGTEPNVSEGTASAEMIMGGRYLQTKLSGTAWGMPMFGSSLEGFDNTTKEFLYLWIDNMGTGFALAKGKYDEENKQIVYTGSMTDPLTKKEMFYKQYNKFLDDNNLQYTMFMQMPDGSEFKSMEVNLTRE